MLSRTLEHLRRAVPIPSHRVAVLFCPALTEKRFNKEQKKISPVSRFLGSRYRDFIAKQAVLFDWPDYCARIALPVSLQLKEIEHRTKAVVMVDATFQIFKQAILSGNFDVLFIVTHHPDMGETLHFEFANGAYSLDEVAALFQKKNPDKRISTIFFTCQSRQVESGLYGQVPGLESVAYADWNMPLGDGLNFLRLWIEFLDGKTTLADAWHKASREVIHGML